MSTILKAIAVVALVGISFLYWDNSASQADPCTVVSEDQ